MSVVYADTSALVSAYLADEADHAAMRALVREGPGVGHLQRARPVELAAGLLRAGRGGRIRRPGAVLERFDDECQEATPDAWQAESPSSS